MNKPASANLLKKKTRRAKRPGVCQCRLVLDEWRGGRREEGEGGACFLNGKSSALQQLHQTKEAGRKNIMPVEACRGRRLWASLQAARNQPRVVFTGTTPNRGGGPHRGGGTGTFTFLLLEWDLSQGSREHFPVIGFNFNIPFLSESNLRVETGQNLVKNFFVGLTHTHTHTHTHARFISGSGSLPLCFSSPSCRSYLMSVRKKEKEFSSAWLFLDTNTMCPHVCRCFSKPPLMKKRFFILPTVRFTITNPYNALILPFSFGYEIFIMPTLNRTQTSSTWTFETRPIFCFYAQLCHITSPPWGFHQQMWRKLV